MKMRILREDTAAVIVDMQERLYPHMAEAAELLRHTEILIHGLKILGIPLVYTEQYPHGLGTTIPEIHALLQGHEAVEKIAFSCCDEPGFMSRLDALNKKFIIIAGIESHVCVLQTCLDLPGGAYVPVIIEDCVSSRRLSDKQSAINRMRQEGALVSSYESILFELCRFAGSDQFKSISKLVK